LVVALGTNAGTNASLTETANRHNKVWIADRYGEGADADHFSVLTGTTRMKSVLNAGRTCSSSESRAELGRGQRMHDDIRLHISALVGRMLELIDGLQAIGVSSLE
jgi:hypothetical protein